MWECEPPALHCFTVRRLHLRNVVHEQELAEVVVDAGTLQMLARADEFAVCQTLAAHRFVLRRAIRPGAAPVVPLGDRSGDLFEVRQRHPVRHEAWTPM